MIDRYIILQDKYTFDIKELHKKVGKLLVIEPSDSDIQEGNTKTQLWFQDFENTLWLIHSWEMAEAE